MDPSSEECCQGIPLDFPVKAPFGKFLVMEIYDGPAGGILICGQCNSVFRGYMVDWDKRHEVRVLALKRLPKDVLVKMLSFMGEEPMWPVWMPSKLIRPTEEVLLWVNNAIPSIEEAAAMRPEYMVSWTRGAKSAGVARKLDPALVSNARDWFSYDNTSEMYDWLGYLGLPR